MDMFTCTNACTHSNLEMGLEEGRLGHSNNATWEHTFLYNYAKGVKLTWGVMWTCIHVVMHVHILTKVWDQMRGYWDVHTGPHRGTHLCTQLCKGWRSMAFQMDKYTHTDACLQPSQDVGLGEG